MRLSATDLSIRLGLRRVFAGVDLEVVPGAPLAVVGANGSGKSTLLKVLAGVLEPSGGTVTLTVDGAAVADRAHRVGLASPEVRGYDALSAREMMAFIARVRGLPDASARAQRALDRVGLGARTDDRVATYSTGMRQRLRLATALVHDPPLLLLDEPGATLDDEGRRLVAELVADSARLVVVATNDPGEAAMCAQRISLDAVAA